MTALPDGSQDVPPGDRPQRHGRHRPAVAVGTLLGGQVSGVSMALAGTPWWAVALAAVVLAVISAAILAAQILVPHESAHKLDWWREVFHYLEKRGRRRRSPRREI